MKMPAYIVVVLYSWTLTALLSEQTSSLMIFLSLSLDSRLHVGFGREKMWGRGWREAGSAFPKQEHVAFYWPTHFQKMKQRRPEPLKPLIGQYHYDDLQECPPIVSPAVV